MPKDKANYALVLGDRKGDEQYLYPIDSANATATSLQEFTKAFATLPKQGTVVAAHKLKLAAEVYGQTLPTDFPMQFLQEKYPEYTGNNVIMVDDLSALALMEKKASSEDGKPSSEDVYHIMGRYPVFDGESAKLASVYFEAHACQMTTEEKRHYAVDFVKIANKIGVDIPYSIKKYAGETLNPNFDAYIEKRLFALDHVKEAQLVQEDLEEFMHQYLLEKVEFPKQASTSLLKTAYQYLSANKNKYDPERLAQVVGYLDKVAGLKRQVPNYVISTLSMYKESPEEEKVASVNIGGRTVTKEHIDWEKAAAVLDDISITKIGSDIRHLQGLPPSILRLILK